MRRPRFARIRPAVRAGDTDSELDLTPLIDVLFILLIFFVVSASFVRVSGVDLDRPAAATASEVPPITAIVTIAADGAIILGGEVIPLEAVAPRVARALALKPGGRVLVEADAGVPAGTLIGVVDAARRGGAGAVAVATGRGAPTSGG